MAIIIIISCFLFILLLKCSFLVLSYVKFFTNDESAAAMSHHVCKRRVKYTNLVYYVRVIRGSDCPTRNNDMRTCCVSTCTVSSMPV